MLVSRLPHRFSWLFMTVVGTAALTLVWLGARLLQQDRDLYASRAVERQEAAADAVVRTLNGRLVAIEQTLAEDREMPNGIARIAWRHNALTVSPTSAWAWAPSGTGLREADHRPFTHADALETEGRIKEAVSRVRVHVGSQDPAIRAAALLRTARLSFKLGAVEGALLAYGALEREELVAFDGMPADLLARRYRGELLSKQERAPEAERETEVLVQDFLEGRWPLARDAWELVAGELAHRLGRPLDVGRSRSTISAAAEALVASDRDEQPRRLLEADGTSVTVLWRGSATAWAAALVPPTLVDAWLREAAGGAASLAPVAIIDERGRVVAGDKRLHEGRLSRRLPTESGLPWTIVVGAVTGADDGLRRREALFATALGTLVLLLIGGGYASWRGAQRGQALARLQADFVSAVSHEFRTPLTSLRHTIDLLEEDDNLPDQQRKSFYSVLSRNTDRLHRLVESLLDFGRMEEGRKPYNLRPVDATKLSTAVAQEFGREVAGRGYVVELEVDEDSPNQVLADPEALSHAIWNLLDNAVKYSPGASRVHLRVRTHRDAVAIEVTDSGLGVAAHERERIFEKFVRGEEALLHSIKGTGVGLAIVSHVVRAHGGSVELESEEGKGSTFRVLLPVST